jgi:hypothetical protein
VVVGAMLGRATLTAHSTLDQDDLEDSVD